MQVNDLVQFVRRNSKKQCKIANELLMLHIPPGISQKYGSVVGFEKKFKFLKNKQIVIVRFNDVENLVYVPRFLLEPFRKIPNHPITNIFL